MSPPLLRSCMSNSSCIRPPRLISPSSPCLLQIRTLTARQLKAKTVFVQLTRDVPKLGVRGFSLPYFSNYLRLGDVVAVKGGRMRNTLFPYSMAQYIRPGTNSFLTQNKLAVPLGPKYRQRLSKSEPDPLKSELAKLFEKVATSLPENGC